jgi:hypothetical protein
MIRSTSEWVIVVIAGSFIAAASFALTSEPLSPLGLISVSFWVSALIIFVSAVLAALVLIDLKRVFLTVPGIALLSAFIYGATLMSPAASLGHYANHLWNYTLVQSVPIIIITLVLTALGVMAGTIINTSVREYDL